MSIKKDIIRFIIQEGKKVTIKARLWRIYYWIFTDKFKGISFRDTMKNIPYENYKQS